MRRLLVISCFFMLGGCHRTKPRESEPVAVVPIKIAPDGFILITATLGRLQNQTFLLDTGSSIALLLDRASADAAGLPRRNHGVYHIQGNEKVDTDDWREAAVKQGKVNLATGDFPAIDLSGESSTLGVKVAGILGATALEKYVSRIDYKKGELSFFEPASFQYFGTGTFLNLQPSGDTNFLLVRGTVKLPDCSNLLVRFFLDSAAYTDVTFHQSFVKEHPKLLENSSLSKSTFTGITSKQIGATSVKLDSVTVAGFSVRAPKVLAMATESAESDDPNNDAALGAAFLQQFTLIVDKPHGHIILEPRLDGLSAPAPPCSNPKPTQ